MRLVPPMQPAETFEKFSQYIQTLTPAGVTVEVRLIHAGEPALVGTDNPYIRAAVAALKTVWKRSRSSCAPAVLSRWSATSSAVWVSPA